jgi:pyrroloquinoline quinone biosynthesis protein B
MYCTASLRRILREHNSVFAMLNRVPNQAVWTEIEPGKSFPLVSADGMDSGLCCEPLTLHSRYPTYVAVGSVRLYLQDASLGLLLSSASGGRLAYLPAVPKVDDALLRWLDTADLLLFDGTFWSDDELIRVQGEGATAREMGHIPVSSPEGSLRKLAALRRPRKVFLHVNNTNPMLNQSSPEYAEVRAAGWEVAEDGWHFEL